MLFIKVLFTKKACSVVFQSSKNEEMTLLHEFIFVFIQYFSGATKSLVYKIQKGGCLSKGGFKLSAHYVDTGLAFRLA